MKRLWTLIQVNPQILARGSDPTSSDLFLALTTVLCYSDYTLLLNARTFILECCLYIIGSWGAGAIYCVIDEAQIGADTYPRAFFSAGAYRSYRPVLRAILTSWMTNDDHLLLVITGTSLNHGLVQEALTSTMGKAAALSDGVTDTGVRFNPVRIQQYLEQYLRPEYLMTPIGRELIRRASENQVGTELLEAVRRITYHRMMNGNLDFVGGGLGLGKTGKKLVECGFARFPGITTEDEAVIDEPLAYLAVEHWIAARQDVTQRHKYFTQHFAHNMATLSGNGLELYIASCLAETFKQFTPLSCHIPGSKGNAVAIQSPSHILCYRSGKVLKDNKLVDDVDGDIRWLRGEVNAPFLLPNTNFGPDLIMCLELEGTQEFIWVAIQVKLKTKVHAGVTLVRQSANSVTPRLFWLD
ncbi:hypothetical protein H0H81_000952, partial [Sphagnurus paluster]